MGFRDHELHPHPRKAAPARLRRTRRRPPPVLFSTSSSIRRWAVKPIISRNRSASELFSRSVRRFIISSVIVGPRFGCLVQRPNPTGIRDDRRKPLARYGAPGRALTRDLLYRATPLQGTRPSP